MLKQLVRTHISLLDLIECDDSRTFLMNGDIDGLKELLHNIGFDKKHIKYKVALHRPLHRNDVVMSGLFESFERTDDEWLNGDMCSIENRISKYCYSDEDLYQIMKNINDVQLINGI